MENIIATFEGLGLPDNILRAVQKLGYTEPTPVQEQAIPVILDGHDIIAAAKTGTGKTAAFALPTMGSINKTYEKRRPSIVVVTPTRELAQQISDTCTVIGRATNLRVMTVVGGLSYEPQIKGLNRGCDVLIATPGRLIDLMHQEAVEMDSVQIVVLDEADRMLDMGFWPQVKEIVDATPEDRQTLLFSATIDPKVDTNAQSVLKDPVMIEIARKGETADTVEQFIIHTNRRERPDLLTNLLTQKPFSRIIVFTKTKGCADNCTRRLNRAGFRAEAIHSDRSQAQRRKALDLFRMGKVDVLVATDVLARGIDVSEVDYVVNYDLPTQIEDYVHRIGRTGRAGESGFAVSFVCPDTKRIFKDIQKFIGKTIPEMELEPPAGAFLNTEDNDPEIAAAKAELKKQEKKEAHEKAKRKGKAEGSHRSNQGSNRNKKNAKHDSEYHEKHKTKKTHEEQPETVKEEQEEASQKAARRPGDGGGNRSKPRRSKNNGHGKNNGGRSRNNSTRPGAGRPNSGKPSHKKSHKGNTPRPNNNPHNNGNGSHKQSGQKRDNRPGRSQRSQRNQRH